MIYLMLADGFEITEALTTVDVLRRAKLDVLTVGAYAKTVTSSCNIKVEADITIDEVEPDKLDAGSSTLPLRTTSGLALSAPLRQFSVIRVCSTAETQPAIPAVRSTPIRLTTQASPQSATESLSQARERAVRSILRC